MTLEPEKQFCTRCTNIHFCIKIGKKWYCQACFEEVVNDPETKRQMEQIMIQCGIEDLEYLNLEYAADL